MYVQVVFSNDKMYVQVVFSNYKMYVQVVFSNYKMYVQVVFSPDEIKRRSAEFNQDKSSQGIILTNKKTGANYLNKAFVNALTTLYSLK